MSIILSMGFRNIFRNSRRSVITSSVVALGLFSMVLMDGFTTGFFEYLIRASTSDFYGEARIRNTEYDEYPNNKDVLIQPQDIISILKANPAIVGYAPRTLLLGMLASAENSRNIQVVGIDPELEGSFSKLKARMVDGKFLGSSRGRILLGKDLASRLGLNVGDKLVFTTTDAKAGDLVQELYRVGGIFQFHNKHLDENIAFIDLAESQRILGLSSGLHEVALKFKTSVDMFHYYETHKGQFAQPGNTLKTWREFLPALNAMIGMSKESLATVGIVLAMLVAFTVMNTIHMSLYERVFEFGVMRAVGTRRGFIKRLIFFECFFIGVFGVLIALAFTLVVGGYLSVYGLDYSNTSYMNVRMRDPIYFHFSAWATCLYSLITVIFVGAISFYPSGKILKILPCDSLRQRG